MKKRKISTKIMLSIIATLLVVVLVISGITGVLIYTNVGKESRDFTVSQVEANVNKFDQSFTKIESAVTTLIGDIYASTDVSKAKRDKSYLQELGDELEQKYKITGEQLGITNSIYAYYNVSLFKQEVDIWMYDADSNGNFNRMDSFGVDYYDDPANTWYHDPINTKQASWTFPYVSSEGVLITSYIAPVVKDGEVIAIVGMDLNLGDIEKQLAEVTLFESGYLYLMHPDGRVLSHPRVEFGSNMLEAGDFQFLLDKMASVNTGFEKYERDDGSNVIAAFSHLSNGWVVGSSIPESEVLSLLTLILIVLAVVAVVVVIVSAIISRFIGQSISKPILEVVKATNKIKDGDFTVHVDVKSKDETRELADSLNDMVVSVRGLIQETQDVSSDMLESASTLAAMSEETSATVDQVATTVDEIASGTTDTAKDAETGARVAVDIDTKFNALMENSQSMADSATEAIKSNESGLEVLTTLKEKSKISQESNEKVVEAVKNLDNRALAITDIISTITSIAEQTNLLALNASIEAARAGEAGRGFAVVADEIRKLAEDSSSAANEISEIILAMQKDSKETVNVMNEVSAISTEQNVVVEDVDAAFRSIYQGVSDITERISTITNELDGLSENKDEIVSIVNNISALSEQTAAATDEVSTSMAEQSKAVDEVARNAERLNDLSTALNKQIRVFKI